MHYEDHSARNDITIAKVAHSKDNIYFYIECLEDISDRPNGDIGFMNVFIKTKESDKIAKKTFLGQFALVIIPKWNDYLIKIQISCGFFK